MKAYLKLARVVHTNDLPAQIIAFIIWIGCVYVIGMYLWPGEDFWGLIWITWWIPFWIFMIWYPDYNKSVEYFLKPSENSRVHQMLADFGFEKYPVPTGNGKYFYFRKISRFKTHIASVQDCDTHIVLTAWPHCVDLFEPRIGPSMLI